MTREEFSTMRFGSGMIAKYKGKEHPIKAVDFEEDLIELEITEMENENFWVRFENVTLIK